jgi:glutathione-independent formaldehyde dehydrogenase
MTLSPNDFISIDDSKVDPVEKVMEETTGLGADAGCECVGYLSADQGRLRA